MKSQPPLPDPPPMPPPRAPRLGLKHALVAFAALLVARLLAADFSYFFEQDEMSLANGVGALMTGSTGYLYHYGPQVGYYRGVQLLSTLMGGIAAVPLVMSAAAAVSGAVIPAVTLLAFRSELSDRTRLLAAAVVAASPVLWISSQYGNSAVVSTALAASGLVVLSNQPKRTGIVAALILCAAAVFVRADAVLVAPVVTWLVIRATGGVKKALPWLLGGAVAFVAVWLGVRFLDPNMGASQADVAEHFADADLRSLFWEHLMWGMSPIVLAFALLGGAEFARRARGLLWVLIIWIVPVCAFYFGSTTTPRYFLLIVVPAGLIAAVGIESIAIGAKRPARTWPVVLTLAFLHLFIGLGHFAPADWSTVFTAPTYDTDDGPMPTGALIYQGYHRGLGLLGSSVRSGGWGTKSFIAQGVDPEIARIFNASGPPGTVYALIDNWNGHVFHFHALKGGAVIEERIDGIEFLAPTRFRLGNSEVWAVGIPRGELEGLDGIDVVEGDEIWHVSPRGPFPAEILRSKLPAGLSLSPTPTTDAGSVVVYTVRRNEG